MTNKEEAMLIRGALIAWHLAILARMERDDPTESYDDLVKVYGKYITTPKYIEEVAECIDFDKLIKLLQS